MTTTDGRDTKEPVKGQPEEAGMFSHAHGRNDEIALTVADETYRWTDVVLFAMRSGEWTALEAQVREGLACEAWAAATDGGPEPADLYAAADVFRTSRGLLTLEQLVAWIDRSGLTVESWLGYVRRALLRRRAGAELPALTRRYPPSDVGVAAVMWAEAVCSGLLERSAVKLAERASVAAALPGTDGSDTKGTDATGTDTEAERAGDVTGVVKKLRALGLRGWALVDCRYRLRRLAALDRRFGRLPSHAFANA